MWETSKINISKWILLIKALKLISQTLKLKQRKIVRTTTLKTDFFDNFLTIIEKNLFS